MSQEYSQGDTPGRLPMNRFASFIIVSLQDLKAFNSEFRKVPGDRFGVVDGNLALLDELQTSDLSICAHEIRSLAPLVGRTEVTSLDMEKR